MDFKPEDKYGLDESEENTYQRRDMSYDSMILDEFDHIELVMRIKQ
jgi:hypothetical protein